VDWDTLDHLIPWVSVGDTPHPPLDVYRLPAGHVTVQQPGSSPSTWARVDGKWAKREGGDFRVDVESAAVGWHGAFQATQLFGDAAAKATIDPRFMVAEFIPGLVRVVAEGEDPLAQPAPVTTPNFGVLPGLDPLLFLAVAQVWALVEHRRYKPNEPAGGRTLATRFIIGIVLGRWTPPEAELTVRSGLQGLEILRGLRGNEPNFKMILGRPLIRSACAQNVEKRP
jgi:hypothetical protein